MSREENIYLVTINDNELYIYSENRRDLKPVAFSADEKENEKYSEMKICNSQVAYNSKFFMVGVVSNDGKSSYLGVFSFNKMTWSAKSIKWLNKWTFSNFYADDHLTTVFLLDEDRRTLDCNFLLWKFDTSKLDHVSLNKLDRGDDDESGNKKKPCCDIF